MGCAYSQDATSPCSTPDLKTTKFNESDKSTPETTNESSEDATNQKKNSFQQQGSFDWSIILLPRKTIVLSTPLEVASDKKQMSSPQQIEEATDQKKTSSPEQGTTSEVAVDKKTSLQEQCKDAVDKKRTNSPEQRTTSKVAADKKKVSSPEQCDDATDNKKTSSPEQGATSQITAGKSSQDQCNTSKDATEQKQKKIFSPKQCTTINVAGDQTNTCSTTQIINESPSFAEALQSNQHHIKWTSCSNMINKLYNASVAVSSNGNTVYVSAWDAPEKSTECNVYRYIVNIDRWMVLPKPQHRRGALCMLGDTLIIIGGDNPLTKEALNKVTTYDSVHNRWCRDYPDMLRRRFKPGVITYGNYVIVIGGKNGKGAIYRSIEVMDYRNLRTCIWKEVYAYLPIPMWNIKPVISGDNIAIVGYSVEERKDEYYEIPVQTIISSVHQCSFTITKWKRLCPTEPLYETTTVPYSNPPVIIGGINHTHHGSILTHDVKLYDASKNSWRKVDSLKGARDCVGVGLINDTTIIVIGGTGGGCGVKFAKSNSLLTVEIGTIVPNEQ